MFDFVVRNVQNTLDKMEIHIFVHISLFETFTGQTRGQEQTRLNVDAVSSVFFGLDSLVEKVLIGLFVLVRGDKFVHSLSSSQGSQLVELLESQGLQCRSVSFLSIDDQTWLQQHFRFVGSDQGFLESGAEDNPLRIGLVLFQGEGQFLIKVISVVHFLTFCILFIILSQSITRFSIV